MIWLVWSLVGFSFVLNLASFTWRLYDVVWWYDKAVHIFTSFAVTLVLPVLLYDRTLKGLSKHPYLLSIVLAMLGLALGSVWEIVEWAGSQLWRGSSLAERRVDVITDLVVDGLGALLGAWAGIVLLRRGRFR